MDGIGDAIAACGIARADVMAVKGLSVATDASLYAGLVVHGSSALLPPRPAPSVDTTFRQ